MKCFQKLIYMLLAVAMVLSMATTAFATGGFSDVPPSLWCYEAVDYAVANGITTGIGNGMFGPDYTCTRGQVVTFLWRAQGCPEPKGNANPFSDVAESDFFYKAVLWAVENGVTSGTSATTFSPDQGCTRGQVATFLWRSKGCPEPTLTINPFYDVPADAYFYKPVLWAVAGCVTTGVSDTSFAPDNTCTRGQIVTFLYRCSGNYVPPKPAVPPVAPNDRFEIASVSCSLNSVEGVDVKILWRNNTGRDLADIVFYMHVYDYLGNLLTCDIGRYSTFEGYIIDPPFPSGVSENIYYVGEVAYTDDGFQTLSYNADYDEYYYTDWDAPFNSPDRETYVSPSNINHTYNATYWDAIMYNGRAQSIGISKVKLTYTDGTVEYIQQPTIGIRSNPMLDKIYTQQMYTRLGCDVVGHTAEPTCTESVLCSRCCKTLPATGHSYRYDGYCQNCYEPFVVDVNLHFDPVQESIERIHTNGTRYTCNITNYSYSDFDVDVEDGIPYINTRVSVSYQYNLGSGFLYIDNEETIYLNVLDAQKNIIAAYHAATYASSSGQARTKYFDIMLPENGDYYLDISFDNHKTEDCSVVGHTTVPTCTKDAVCSRCKETLKATGHSYNTSGECRNCDHVFTLDVTLAQGVVQQEVDRFDKDNKPYSCVIESMTISDPELTVVDNAPTGKYTVRVYFDYVSDNYISSSKITEETIYLNIYDSDKNLIATHEATAEYGDSYAYFSKVYVPGTGDYTVDVSFFNGEESCEDVGHANGPSCTEDAVCSRCGETLPAFGHKYSYSNKCDNCGKYLIADAQLKLGQLDNTTYSHTDSYGNSYTFHLTAATTNIDDTVKISSGKPYVEAEVTVNFDFTYDDSATKIQETLKLELYDKDGNPIKEYTTPASAGSLYISSNINRTAYFSVDIPATGVTYMNISVM